MVKSKEGMVDDGVTNESVCNLAIMKPSVLSSPHNNSPNNQSISMFTSVKQLLPNSSLSVNNNSPGMSNMILSTPAPQLKSNLFPQVSLLKNKSLSPLDLILARRAQFQKIQVDSSSSPLHVVSSEVIKPQKRRKKIKPK
jgi:hypothetical protein